MSANDPLYGPLSAQNCAFQQYGLGYCGREHPPADVLLHAKGRLVELELKLAQVEAWEAEARRLRAAIMAMEQATP